NISHSGRFVPYVDWGKDADLYLHDLSTGADRQITNTATQSNPKAAVEEYAEEFSLSRDDSQLAYSWYRGGDHKRYELRVVDLRVPGFPPYRVVLDNEDIQYIAPDDWTPDGKWLAVRIGRKDRTTQIGLVSLQDGSLRILKSLDWKGPGRIFLSPDGKYLGYDLPEGAQPDPHDVFVMAIDGSREIPIAPHRGHDRVAGWSPDGKQLLFSSD